MTAHEPPTTGRKSPAPVQPPSLRVVRGDAMTADRAAWAMVAETGERALMLPGLSANGRDEMWRMVVAARRVAGLPPPQHQRGAPAR